MHEVWKRLEHGRPKQTPKRVIVHAMASRIRTGGTVLDAVDFLDRQGLSAHALITPAGTVIRCRDDEQGAWHAKGHNVDTLGVEVLVPGEHDYVSFLAAMQTDYVSPGAWRAVLELVSAWILRWEIGVEDVFRHSDVDPERKVDPGRGFDWATFTNLLERSQENTPSA